MKEPKRSKVYVVYKTDANMSVCSYKLMGIFGTIEKAVHAVITKGEFDDDWMEEQQSNDLEYIKDFLKDNMQTPSCGVINYVIKEGTLNDWEELF